MNALSPDAELRELLHRLSRKELADLALWHANECATITQHLLQPMADDKPPQLIVLPPARKRGAR